MQYPVLYSFRRWPYAMRARLALLVSGTTFELREVLLKNKPQAMLNASPKGTVPVLILGDKTVLDESLDIMVWALENTNNNWLTKDSPTAKNLRENLINQNDTEFKYYLDRYKYFDHHPEQPQDYYLGKALPHLKNLEKILSEQAFLSGSKFGFTDAAIAPFIRQFYMVDQSRFKQLKLPNLETWLLQFLESSLFKKSMEKQALWNPDDEATLLNNDEPINQA